MKRAVAALLVPFFVAPVSLALAQQSEVLKREAAFGGWRADKPGTRRLLTPQDLPRPYVSDSASNSPGEVRRPKNAEPKLPAGFSAELIASGISNPRAVRVAPNGDIFVADSRADQVRLYRPGDGSTKPAEEAIYAKGLSSPYGIAFHPSEIPATSPTPTASCAFLTRTAI